MISLMSKCFLLILAMTGECMAKSIVAYGAQSKADTISQMTIERREVTPSDISIDIMYCGICHSDIHQVNNDWGRAIYPIVPGHEIIGEVTNIGNQVTKFKVGDIVGVGVMVGSCGNCGSCTDNLEQYCEKGFISTYSSEDPQHGGVTYGGYSENIVVDEKFVLHVPTNLALNAVAPLLCAGITTYSPLRNWKVKPGDTVGIIGLGGLGHMGVKFAKAMGANVVMITSSTNKAEDAKSLGADAVIISKNPEDMKNNANKFDILLNTVPVSHDLNPYLSLLKRDGTMILVGAIEPFKSGELNGVKLIVGRKSLAGSLIGGLQETQEMLDFCGENNILPDVEMITASEINNAYKRMLNNDVKYRFVIDFTKK
jgi:uncharacterized zinc-type alcohol dehydrogenase-like protein